MTLGACSADGEVDGCVVATSTCGSDCVTLSDVDPRDGVGADGGCLLRRCTTADGRVFDQVIGRRGEEDARSWTFDAAGVLVGRIGDSLDDGDGCATREEGLVPVCASTELVVDHCDG